jgi:very-short-patch-repair endonuclease
LVNRFSTSSSRKLSGSPLLTKEGSICNNRHMTDKIHNTKNLKHNRKKLRNSLTPAEAKLWSLLKNSQLNSKKFKRQHSVGPYVLDFYCPSERLCIELDGAAHFTEGGYEYDEAKTEYLSILHIRVLRFENKDVFENTEGVLEIIRKSLCPD